MQTDVIQRIRGATFSTGRRGYDKREVERFLARLAEWLETGGDDEARAAQIRSDLERVGEQTGAILAAAHDAAVKLKEDAQEEARSTLASVRGEAERERTSAEEWAQKTRTEADRHAMRVRQEADEYAAATRKDADSYAEQTRSEADGYSVRVRREADEAAAEERDAAAADADAERANAAQDAKQTVEAAEVKARRAIDEGTKRRKDIESVISDLMSRRDAVLEDIRKLSGELTTAVGSYAAASDAGADVADADRGEEAGSSEADGKAEPEKGKSSTKPQRAGSGAGRRSGPAKRS